MAFNINNLVCIGGNSKGCSDITAGALGKGAPRLWSYITEDTAATVDTAGYFNSALSLLNIGDVIMRITVASGALSTGGFHIVKDKSATAIDVTDALAMTVTDTD